MGCCSFVGGTVLEVTKRSKTTARKVWREVEERGQREPGKASPYHVAPRHHHLYVSVTPHPRLSHPPATSMAIPIIHIHPYPPLPLPSLMKSKTWSRPAHSLSGAAAATNCRYYRTSSNFFGHLGIISTIGVERVPTVIGRPLPHLSTIAGSPEEAASPPPWLGTGRRGRAVWTRGIGTEPPSPSPLY